MSVSETEAAVTELSPEEFAKFSAWFIEYQASNWDEEIERDLASGRLNALLGEVDAEYDAGKAKPLRIISRCLNDRTMASE